MLFDESVKNLQPLLKFKLWCSKGRGAFKFDNQGATWQKKIYAYINEGGVNYITALPLKRCKPTVNRHLTGDKKVFFGVKIIKNFLNFIVSNFFLSTSNDQQVWKTNCISAHDFEPRQSFYDHYKCCIIETAAEGPLYTSYAISQTWQLACEI